MILLYGNNINRPEGPITRFSDYFSEGAENAWVAFYQLHSILGLLYPLSPVNPFDNTLQ